MSPFSASLFGLLVLTHALTVCLSESAVNISEPQGPTFLPETLGSSQQQDQYKLKAKSPNKELSDGNKAAYTNYRSKRDSGELEDELNADKRPRDFVGKRSQLEMYSSIPEPLVVTPVDITGTGQGPLELDSSPEESFLDGSDVNDIQNNNEDPEEQIWNYKNKRLRDFVGKRSSGLDTDWWGSYNKRLRDFVGKRSNDEFIKDLLDKRRRDFVGKRGHAFYEGDIENEKRLRDFVGKRSDLEDLDGLVFADGQRQFISNSDRYSNHIDKRPRDFLGKRDDIEKRLRDFVGKRASYFIGTPDINFEKRPRQFVGKRYWPHTFMEDKRVREFVGKRDQGDIFNEDKRIREFIGKRENKRAREFVGKRSIISTDGEDNIELTKKLRDFVGKRSDDEQYQEDKRLRDFVGKRSEFDEDSVDLSALKRLRDFVGKRNYISDLNSPVLGKRIREFIGRR